MQRQDLEDPRLPDEEETQRLLELAKDQKLQTSIATLIDMPEEWDKAMMDPLAWLRAQGIEMPQGLKAVIIKEISISKPLDPEIAGTPGPDWIPYNIRLTNCRTYWIPTRDDNGKITGVTEEMICFGFEIVLNPQPGPFG